MDFIGALIHANLSQGCALRAPGFPRAKANFYAMKSKPLFNFQSQSDGSPLRCVPREDAAPALA